TLTNCSNGKLNDSSKGTIRAEITKTTGKYDATDFLDCGVGGVVGSLDYYNPKGGPKEFYSATLECCDNYGSVTDAITTGTYCAASSGSRHHLGGIVGRIFGKAPTSKANPEVTLTVCNNRGEVECSAPVVDTLAMGGVVGLAVNYSKLDGCINQGALSVTNAVTSDVAYCTVGGNLGFAQKGVWLYGYNSGAISVDAQPSGTNTGISKLNIGGVVGRVFGKAPASKSDPDVFLDLCTNEGAVECSAQVVDTLAMGGITGLTFHYPKFYRCVNEGSLSVTNAVTSDVAYCTVGGNLGIAHKGIWLEQCENKGNISVEAEPATSIVQLTVGGILAYAPMYSKLVSCKNMATNQTLTLTSKAKWNYFGGILGHTLHGAEVNGCSNSAALTTTGNLLDKYFRVGGVVGNFVCKPDDTGDPGAPVSIPYGTISGCTNTGNVSASCAGGITGLFPYVGGVLGSATSGAVYLCSSRSTGRVSFSVSSGSMDDVRIGGLAGYMGYTGGKIDGCRTYANVSCTGTVTTLRIAEIMGYCGATGAFTIRDNKVGGEVNGTVLDSSNWKSFRANKAAGGTSFTYSGNSFWSNYPND
ncbi:MAG: hypothetical protein K6E37_08750, partial [Bacteroidales bacterium]|nr:hypothetical protein [Bacteroidales bacterium]